VGGWEPNFVAPKATVCRAEAEWGVRTN
jgi:hypothetical protein